MVAAASLAREGGYALIYRKVLENPVFTAPWEAMAFVALILQAQWKPARIQYRRRIVLLERGQLVISVRDFARQMERPQAWAQRFLDRLEEAGMIKRRRYSRDTVGDTVTKVITICNYEVFQVVQGDADTVAETPTDTKNNTKNEGKKERVLRTPKKERATPWQGGDLPDEWLTWACSNLGWSRASAAAEGTRFIDSALAKRRTYVDWFAAWRQWCRSPYQKTEAPRQERLTL